MKKIFTITLLSFLVLKSYSQAYIVSWNSTSSKYEIKGIDLTNGAITNVGTSSTMNSEYDINEIYYDQSNNQIIAIYQNTDLWKYNLASNTDQIIDLGTDPIRDLEVNGNAYIVKWNSTTSKYEIKGIDLTDGTISDIGTSSTMSSEYDINEIYLDYANNSIVAIYQNTDLWKYNLTSNTDQIIDLGTEQLRALTVEENAYLVKWNSTDSKYEIKGIDLTNGTITNIGTASNLSSEYDINEIYYDKENNQIVAIAQNTHLWSYNLTSTIDSLLI